MEIKPISLDGIRQKWKAFWDVIDGMATIGPYPRKYRKSPGPPFRNPPPPTGGRKTKMRPLR